jgi:hypothetical protein
MSDEFGRETNRECKGVQPVFMLAFTEIVKSLPPSVGVKSITIEYETERIVRAELDVVVNDYEGREAIERLAESHDLYQPPSDAIVPAHCTLGKIYIRYDEGKHIVENSDFIREAGPEWDGIDARSDEESAAEELADWVEDDG